MQGSEGKAFEWGQSPILVPALLRWHLGRRAGLSSNTYFVAMMMSLLLSLQGDGAAGTCRRPTVRTAECAGLNLDAVGGVRKLSPQDKKKLT